VFFIAISFVSLQHYSFYLLSAIPLRCPDATTTLLMSMQLTSAHDRYCCVFYICRLPLHFFSLSRYVSIIFYII